MPPQPTIPCICPQCGVLFYSWPSWLRTGRKFCSRNCAGVAHQNTLAIVWDRLDRNGPNGCWLWISTLDSQGYGVFHVNGLMIKAHRAAYTLTYGAPPTDKPFVCHWCNVRPCCNPAHLYADDTDGNMRYMVESDRSMRGERNSHARLTADNVRAIRRRYDHTWGAVRALAREYGVADETVGMIVRGETWRHLL